MRTVDEAVRARIGDGTVASAGHASSPWRGWSGAARAVSRGSNPRLEEVTVTGCCCWWGVSGGHSNTAVTAALEMVEEAPGFRDAAQVNEPIMNPRNSDAGGTVVACTDVDVEEVDEVSDEPGAVEVVVGCPFSVALGDEEQAVKISPAEQAAAASRLAHFQGTLKSFHSAERCRGTLTQLQSH